MPTEGARLRTLNDRPVRAEGRYVLYWMQQSQRAEENPALEHAAALANELRLPLVVGFGLMDDYPGANLRHYLFLAEGLRETAAAIQARGGDFVLQRGAPATVALRLGEEAAAIVCDRGYTRHQRAWREEVASGAGCRVEQVEGDVIVPVETASPKAEFAARTIRAKIYRAAESFFTPPGPVRLRHPAAPLNVERLATDDPEKLCTDLKLDRSVGSAARWFPGGTREAKRRFRDFCEHQLEHYAERRSEPSDRAVSRLSAYLHFGQISPVWLAAEMRTLRAAHPEVQTSAASWLEELLVRRELGMNFVHYIPAYDRYECLPAWARQTLGEHAGDPRPRRYTYAQFEAGETYDPYWNAAMREMRLTGYLHNHLRMYWGKKILEWSASPEEGYETALALNNRWFLCGRDPASFANIGWVFGLHDRPWGERPIYGKIRCMMASGLERKCDMPAYLRQVEALEN